MLNEYLAEARLSELRQAAIRINIERAAAELSNESRPRPIPSDPVLYARFVWYGSGA